MQPLRREDHPELEELFAHYDRTLSFVPNSLYTMARRPEILRAFSDLITQIWNTGTLPKELKPLVGIVASVAAGCRYCQAHEAVDASARGVDEAKISEIWNFERSPLYDDAERAALRFARDAALVPNEVTPATTPSNSLPTCFSIHAHLKRSSTSRSASSARRSFWEQCALRLAISDSPYR